MAHEGFVVRESSLIEMQVEVRDTNYVHRVAIFEFYDDLCNTHAMACKLRKSIGRPGPE